MEVNFLKQNPCMPSGPGVFQFYVFSAVLSESMFISAFSPCKGPSGSLLILIHSAFLLCFLGCHILLQNCFVSHTAGCWYVLVQSPPTFWWNFSSLIWNVLICLYSFNLYFLIYFLYFLIYFLELYSFFYLCCFFFPKILRRFFFALSFLLVVVDF